MSDYKNISGSLRNRLIAQLLISAALLATLLFVLVRVLVGDLAEESHDSILSASATSILDSVSVVDGEISVDIPYAALSMLGNAGEDRVFYRVSRDAEVITGYDDLPKIEKVGGTETFKTVQYRDENVRVVSIAQSLPLNGNPTTIDVTVAQTLNGQARILEWLTNTALIIGFGFFVLASVLAIWSAQSTIKPLSSLTQAISRRGPKDLRAVARPVPAEMAPLVSSLNSFIDRLRLSLGRSEEFITEAAHRVRTPLATVRTQAEIILRRVEREENRHSLREMIKAVDESSRAASQLLDHAMVALRTDSLELELIDIAELVEDMVTRLQPVAELKDIELDFAADASIKMNADAILLQNAVRNIIDNAIKYSPHEGKISVDVARTDTQIDINITDQAGGFGTSNPRELIGRFTRGNKAVGTVGSGLGLTIAHEVALSHNGALRIKNMEGTGACVSLSFPAQ